MIKSKIKLIVLLFLFFLESFFAQPKGYLIIIGGGNRTDEIMTKILELSKADSRVLIIPNASSEPLITGERLKKEFQALGFKDVLVFYGDREKANDEGFIKQFKNCNVVFFSGGDQNLLTRDLLNTSLLELIKSIYKSGGVVSGTSAGAAVMSKIMITGDEYINKDSSNPFNCIEAENIITSEGFGFIENSIIDQHFIKRKRLNRLISVVLENQDKLGIGIDESTAIVVYPDQTFEVIGESQVIVFDPTKSTQVTKNQSNKLSGSNILMHILVSGQKFDLKSKSVIK